SIAEGFGLPPLEAMQAGCPLCYSIDTSLAEVVDYNGQFFKPTSISNLKQALKTLWTNKKLRQHFSKSGIQRAKQFDWSLTAQQTLAVYKLIQLNE
ncbi:glycosyltransferase family 1 protein, partial [Candidatus Shapirobacteria bacterium]